MKKSDYNKLKAKWYAKLKKSGFDDLEVGVNQDLKTTATSGGIIDTRRIMWKSTEEYYQMATDFLNSYSFKSNLERIIWEYHANGISVRGIVETLNKVRKKKILRMTVWRCINKLELIMKKQNGVIK